MLADLAQSSLIAAAAPCGGHQTARRARGAHFEAVAGKALVHLALRGA